MEDPTRVANMLLDSAAALADTADARAIIVAADALPPLDILPPDTLLIARSSDAPSVVKRLRPLARATIEVPNVELDRMGQVKLAAVIALSNRLLDLGDTAIFLTGPYRSILDSLVVMTMGVEYELFDTTEQSEIDEHIKRAVFHRVLTISLQLGQHGREGRKVGALFVVGDHNRVIENCKQMILNPFKGYGEKDRNLLDDAMSETIKEFSSIDGAFVIHGNGVIESAGAHLRAGLTEGLPPGLGARHAAAAGITSLTRSIAFTVSESDGTVRVWRSGKLLASFEPSRR